TALLLANVPDPGPNAPDAKDAASPKPTAVRLDVYPPTMHLSSAVDRQTIIAMLTLSDGTTQDVTGKATFTPADARFAAASVGEDGGVTFHPSADGVTTVKVAYEDKSVEIPLTVENSEVTPKVGFR